MILMATVFDLVAPNCSPTNMFKTPISFNYQNVANIKLRLEELRFTQPN